MKRKKSKKVWKIGQTRSFPWCPGVEELFKPFPIENPPETFKARLNKYTVTISYTHQVGGIDWKGTARIDRREFFS